MGLALGLIFVSDTFMMMLPTLVVWFLVAGYGLVRGADVAARRRGVFIMALGEVGLFVFGVACIVIEPTRSPEPGTLFSSIMGFADFPLLVVAIVMLALGWRTGPGGERGTTPPYFAGTLALLVGLLTMLLNNFQSGTLAGPGTDQTVLVFCLVYVVFALHGPRRLQWVVPPMLFLAAVAYTVVR